MPSVRTVRIGRRVQAAVAPLEDAEILHVHVAVLVEIGGDLAIDVRGQRAERPAGLNKLEIKTQTVSLLPFSACPWA